MRAGVDHRPPERELALRLDANVRCRVVIDVGIDEQRRTERVVHRSGVGRLRRGCRLEYASIRRPMNRAAAVTGGSAERLERVAVGLRDERAVRRVERHERQRARKPAAKTMSAASGSAQMLNSADGGLVAERMPAAHDHHAVHRVGDARVDRERGADVAERPDRDERDLLRRRAQRLDQELDGTGVLLDARRRAGSAARCRACPPPSRGRTTSASGSRGGRVAAPGLRTPARRERPMKSSTRSELSVQ